MADPELSLADALRSVRRLRRKTREASRIWRLTRDASPVGVSRIYGATVVGDLPERTLAVIGAQAATSDVVDELDRLLRF